MGILRFKKKIKKLNKYYFYIKFYNLFMNNYNKNFIFLNLNSFKNINFYLIKKLLLNYNNTFIISFKFQYLSSFFNKLKFNFKILYLLKSVNNLLFIDTKYLNYKFLLNLYKLSNINFNLTYIKLVTHHKLSSLHYLMNLLNKYGKYKNYSILMIIHLINFNNIKFIKILSYKNK